MANTIYLDNDFQNLISKRKPRKYRRPLIQIEFEGKPACAVLLTENKYAVIDIEDSELIKSFSWFVHKDGYAQTNLHPYGDGRSYKLFMHRLILKAPPDMEVDHINHNRLDNRRVNLRICTKSENQLNRRDRIQR